ncbi:enoyl-CoA hydratase/isomerase family protein [Microbacterium sp. BWT-B31]|uniref:enoyl-CoA hydratase/isomerase family protein n=1 Tax=Microbacterium sp. BWT-B31 TaxID=3232072 RepID=UPI003528233A
MTAPEAVIRTTQNGVATITLNQPQSGNALTVELATALADASEAAGADADVAVIVLQGAGPRFCVGGDLRSIRDADDPEAYLRVLIGEAHRAILALHEVDKPVIVALQGAVAGGGLGLSLVADLAYADSSTRFTFAYPAVGLTVDCGSSWLLPRVVGARRALQMALTADSVGIEEAVRVGLVSEHAENDAPQSRAAEVAARLAAAAPGAAGVCRRLMRDGWGDGLDVHLDRELESMLAATRTARTRALIDGFFNDGKAARWN